MPPPREFHAMAYDNARGVVVLFGGDGDSGVVGDTWELNENVWTLRSTTGPAPRKGHAMAYDSARGVTVLFGGEDSSGFLGDTWEWDGTSWTLRSASGPARAYHAMAYDSTRNVTVLFGGFSLPPLPGLLGDTWEWNGTSWTLRSNTGPAPRYSHAVAYDSERGVTVLFGGYAPGLVGDTWEWNGTSWSLRSTSDPPPNAEHAMSFDSDRGVTVLSGGVAGYGQTWEWNGSAWTAEGDMVWHPRRHATVHRSGSCVLTPSGCTVLFGGRGTSGLRSDTREWDGGRNWSELTSGPAASNRHAMAYDSGRGVSVLFGGNDEQGNFLHGEGTWEWNGTTWDLHSVVGPPLRSTHAMAYDSARGVTVLFGGLNYQYQLVRDTWEWNGTIWTLRSLSGPSSRYWPAMAYDSNRGVTVLFGGSANNIELSDTWEWNGATWALRSTSGPPPLFLPAMAYDSSRGVTVLCGGAESAPGEFTCETWEWNGTVWALKSAFCYIGSMIYDSIRGVTVVSGGGNTTWEWDGQSWSLRSTSPPGPSWRDEYAAAFDNARGVTVLFGGREYHPPFGFVLRGDTWEYSGICGPSEACCFPSGQCISAEPTACTAFGGTPQGAGSTCQGDTNGDGFDQTCEGDCDGDTILDGDETDLAQRDCDRDGVCNGIEIANCLGAPACADCNGNGVPDGCEPDCNGNQIADGCDIANCSPGNLSCADCNGNGIPDGCEPDCNYNQILDSCDIANCPPGNLACDDCNSNGIPDGCEVGACCLDANNDGNYESCSQSNEQDCTLANGIWRGACRPCPTQNATIIPEGGGTVFVHVIGPPINCFAQTMPLRGECPPSGPYIDAWKSDADASMCHNFGAAGHAIPADFFDLGSDVFTSPVCLEGVPLGTPGFGEADTLIQRLADPFDRCALPSATESSVQIDISALNMVSTGPMTVTYNGGQDPEQWTVAVDLSTEAPPSGTLTAAKTHCNGGTYTSVLYVQPRFTFTKVGDSGQVRVLDTGLSDIPPVILDQQNPAPWVHDVDPNLGLTGDPCSTFHAGIEDQVQETACDCNANQVRDKCDIEEETSVDCNLNQVPDDCDLFTCNDSNPCTDETCPAGAGCQYVFNTLPCKASGPCVVPGSGMCAAGQCHGTPVVVLYADISPSGGDGNVDVGDVLKILDVFAGTVLCPECDLSPCGGDGNNDVGDILAVLDAFAGIYACPHPCPP